MNKKILFSLSAIQVVLHTFLGYFSNDKHVSFVDIVGHTLFDNLRREERIVESYKSERWV